MAYLERATREEYLLLASRPRVPFGAYNPHDTFQLERSSWIGSPSGDIWTTANYLEGWQYYMIGEEIRKITGRALIDSPTDAVTDEVLAWAVEVSNASR